MESRLKEVESETLRILILGTGYPRFREDFSNVYLHRLAVSLVKIGVKVHVVVPHAEGLRKEEVMDGVRVHRFQYMWPQRFQTLAYFPGIPEKIKEPFNKLQTTPLAISMTKKMLQVIRRFGIDVVNAHWALPPAFLSILTKPLHGRPVLTTLYGVELFTARSKYSGLKPILSWTINNSDSVVAISDATRRSALDISGRKDVAILPDGIDTEHFSPSNSGDEIVRRHGLHGWNAIFSCGRMIERKGFSYLIEAMPHVLKSFRKTKLIIAGEGPERSRLEKLVHELGIDQNVIFPGFVTNVDLSKYYSACDVFVLPAIIDRYGDTEGSGTILLEAMASGKPVIGTNVGGIPYALRHGGGFLVEEKDPLQLAEKIVILLDNNELRYQLGKDGRMIVEKEFSWTKIANRYIQKFEMLLRAK